MISVFGILFKVENDDANNLNINFTSVFVNRLQIHTQIIIKAILSKLSGFLPISINILA